MERQAAYEFVVSGHEAAHAVACVRLGLPFDYVTVDPAGPHVHTTDNLPRPINFYRGGHTCCSPSQPMCDGCRAEADRAEAYMIMAMCGSIGVAASPYREFGSGHDADKAYVIQFCRTAFGDTTDEDIDRRMHQLLQRAKELMRPEMDTLSAVARELRTRGRLSEVEVKNIIQSVTHNVAS